jgi:hypothetical protein
MNSVLPMKCTRLSVTSANSSREGAQIKDSLSKDPVASVLRRLLHEAEIADRLLTERYRDRGWYVLWTRPATNYKARLTTYNHFSFSSENRRA